MTAKYYVYYSLMTPEGGTNPFGHTCLTFVKMLDDDHPAEVEDSIGFYSQPTTTKFRHAPLVYVIKQLIALQFDLQDTHGIFEREKLRYLDSGKGLLGEPFELTEAQYTTLLKQCRDERDEEKAVIDELNKEIKAGGGTPDAAKRWALELSKSTQPPRLHKFHFELNHNMTLFGPNQGLNLTTEGSHTCKDRAINLLSEIKKEDGQPLIPKGTFDKYRRSTKRGALGYSVPMGGEHSDLEPLLLASQGQLFHFNKGKVNNYYRKWQANHGESPADMSKLFMLVPPLSIINKTRAEKSKNPIPEPMYLNYCLAVKRLIILERAMINSQFPERLPQQKNDVYDALVTKLQTIGPMKFFLEPGALSKNRISNETKELERLADQIDEVMGIDKLPALWVLQVCCAASAISLLGCAASLLTAALYVTGPVLFAAVLPLSVVGIGAAGLLYVALSAQHEVNNSLHYSTQFNPQSTAKKDSITTPIGPDDPDAGDESTRTPGSVTSNMTPMSLPPTSPVL